MHYVEVKGILSNNNGMNIYRGCSHGCIYCDSRSKCYNFDHDFEDIEVKINAPELLEKALKSKRNRCMVGTGSMCDPYLHVEEKLCLTRKCLEIIDKYECGVTLLTKSNMVLRDLDLLKSINNKARTIVQMTLTTYDENLCKIIEPNVCTTYERFKTLMKFKEEGIETVVWLCPLLPFINDTKENLLGLLDYLKKANVKGIVNFGFGLTLRDGDREYFYQKLDEHFPGLKQKYQSIYGNAYELNSPNHLELKTILDDFCKENNILRDDKCFDYMKRLPDKFEQTCIF